MPIKVEADDKETLALYVDQERRVKRIACLLLIGNNVDNLPQGTSILAIVSLWSA